MAVLCKAPFTSVHYIASNNLVGFCCEQTKSVLEPNQSIKDWWTSEYAVNFRQEILKGNFPDPCRKCVAAETENDKPRTAYDNLPLKNPNALNGNDIGKPIMVDYRIENLCNLRCTMCEPRNSILIEKLYKKYPETFSMEEFDLPFDDPYNRDGTWEPFADFIDEDTIILKMNGGEPTLQKECVDLLQFCIDNGFAKNMELKLTTNATVLPDNFYNLLDYFKKVRIGISLDGTGETYNYIRNPGKWNVVKENINILFAEQKPNQYVNSNLVWQPSNAFTVDKWYPELKNIFGDIGIIQCLEPIGMTFASMPEKYKDYVKSKLDTLGADREVSDMYEGLDKFEYDANMLKIFQNKTKTMDKHKKTNITKLDPMYAELLAHG